MDDKKVFLSHYRRRFFCLFLRGMLTLQQLDFDFHPAATEVVVLVPCKASKREVSYPRKNNVSKSVKWQVIPNANSCSPVG